MTAVTLPAHYDGQHILLDEPYSLEPNTRLAVILLPTTAEDEEREDYLRMAEQGVAAACSDDEPEYTLDDIKIWNPKYQGR